MHYEYPPNPPRPLEPSWTLSNVGQHVHSSFPPVFVGVQLYNYRARPTAHRRGLDLPNALNKSAHARSWTLCCAWLLRMVPAQCSQALFLCRCGWGLDIVGQPSQALKKAFASRRATRNDEPYLVLKLVEFEGFGYFLWLHGCAGKIMISIFAFALGL